MRPRTAEHPTRPESGVGRVTFRWWWPLIAVAVIGALVVSAKLISSSPTTVDRVAIVNDSNYDINVAVTGAAGDGRLPLGTAIARSTTNFQQVIDPGNTWIVHFTGQGLDAGEMTIGRDAVANAGWQIVIPSNVAARLEAAGVPVSPKA